MQSISEINIGRLKSKTDFSQGIEFDLTKYPTFVPVLEVKFVDPDINDYAIVISGFTNDYFAEKFVTQINHFFLVKEMVNGEIVWTEVEDKYIDNSVFPNLRSLITSMDLYLDLSNGQLYDKGNSLLYENDITKEVFDKDGNPFEPKKYEQKLRTNIIPYYEYLSKSTTGQSIFTMITTDINNRLNAFVV